jgi:cytochrome c
MNGSAVAVVLALLVVSCSGGRQPARAPVPGTGGSADRGERLISSVGCGRCHTIPGVRSANGLVGPPLNFFSKRTYIAGELPNTPDNLVRWLRDPPSIEPGTAMPNLGLSEQDARDIAAYLYTLS